MFRFALVALSALILSATANAACTQAQISGKWQTYSGSWNNSQSWWTRCTFTVGATGVMSGGTCANSLNQAGPISNGSIKLTSGPNCTYTATFRVGGETNKVTHATLAKYHNTATGVGTFPAGAFIFTMTKL
jgi:hypothetical protein